MHTPVVEAPGIAEVALNVPLRRTFDYRLTPEQAMQVQPGCRVIVPFGARVRSGIVVALKAESDVPAARLKGVQQVTAGPPLLPSELLAFTKWIADYYFCGWGEVLEAALPSGLAVKFRTHFRPKEALVPEAVSRLSLAAQSFLTKHTEWEQVQFEQATKHPEDLAWLWRQARPGGLLAMHQEFAGTKARPRLEKWVRLGRT